MCVFCNISHIRSGVGDIQCDKVSCAYSLIMLYHAYTLVPELILANSFTKHFI